MQKEQLNSIQQEVEAFFEKLGLEGRVEFVEKEDGVEIQAIAEEPRMYIGENGQTLNELQHIVNLVLRKKFDFFQRANVDVNEYKKNKEQYIRELTKSAADEVALNNVPKELPPMSAAERRIVHMEISQRTDVISESIGEEPERRVVIKSSATGVRRLEQMIQDQG